MECWRRSAGAGANRTGKFGSPFDTCSCSSEQTRTRIDRKSTRLNSSHGYISYAVFCLKKKKQTPHSQTPRSRPTQTTTAHASSAACFTKRTSIISTDLHQLYAVLRVSHSVVN